MMDLGTLKCLPDVSFSGFTVAIILSSTHIQFVMASRFEPFYLWSFFLSDILLFIQTLTDTAYKYISDVCSRSLYLCTAPTPRIQQQQLSEIPWLHLPWKGSWYFEPSLAIEWLKVVKRNRKFTNLWYSYLCFVLMTDLNVQFSLYSEMYKQPSLMLASYFIFVWKNFCCERSSTCVKTEIHEVI